QGDGYGKQPHCFLDYRFHFLPFFMVIIFLLDGSKIRTAIAPTIPPKGGLFVETHTLELIGMNTMRFKIGAHQLFKFFKPFGWYAVLRFDRHVKVSPLVFVEDRPDGGKIHILKYFLCQLTLHGNINRCGVLYWMESRIGRIAVVGGK